jgi:hypothetical protein
MLETPRKAPMTSPPTSPCIHGFEAGQCASCHPPNPPDAPQPIDEERDGWQIFYVPDLSGWQIRRPDTAPTPDSYRSLFLARKAVDQMVANSPTARPAKRRT